MEENNLTEEVEQIKETINHFVDNKTFINLLVIYNNNPDSLEGKKAYEKIGKILILIANKLSQSGSFRQYSPDIKEEMIQDSIYMMIKNLKHYNHEAFSNPFSFFTTIAFNIFRQHLNKLKVKMERYVRLESIQDNGLEYMVKDLKFSDKIHYGKVSINKD
jgi:hypothetical protein